MSATGMQKKTLNAGKIVFKSRNNYSWHSPKGEKESIRVKSVFNLVHSDRPILGFCSHF
jgi:hypothetical protein